MPGTPFTDVHYDAAPDGQEFIEGFDYESEDSEEENADEGVQSQEFSLEAAFDARNSTSYDNVIKSLRAEIANQEASGVTFSEYSELVDFAHALEIAETAQNKPQANASATAENMAAISEAETASQPPIVSRL